LAVNPNYFGDNNCTLGVGMNRQSRGFGDLDIECRFDPGDSYNLALHCGWQGIRHFSDYNWQHASVTVSRNILGFDVALAYGKAWNGHGVYRNVTTCVLDRQGRLHFSDPMSSSLYLTIGREF
jgi:hypothetical protein